ncbi:N-formylglutamate amidohydrolase [Psychroserpens mesophilus]|uniref:N-formylglutamate amidohydrolase n=1 Tax=Psychroserpens mesophilus TaxID=325473 RepID=UPI00058B86B9|nr:N-formylglutamate amidohydrolase [Psychroserpens mesophilus]
MILILTCEHGGNEIPDSYKFVFNNASKQLQTHRGFDLGALDTFEYLKDLARFSMYSKTSRLLIELNRSLHHNNLFSEFTKSLKPEHKNNIIETYYLPYRNCVESEISKLISNDELVLHLSIHSFTPKLNSVERKCDVGLLYDSERHLEKEFSKALKLQLNIVNPDLNVRYNYPYLGKADGFTCYLRKQFPEHYIGIEIEINQKFSKSNVMDSNLKQTLRLAIQSCLQFRK